MYVRRRVNDAVRLGVLNSLLRLEEYLTKQTREKGYNTLIREEESMFAHKFPSWLEWLKFSLQLGNSDHSGNELDVLLLKEVFVLSLGVLCDETYGSRAWIDGWVSEGADKIDKSLAKACVDKTRKRVTDAYIRCGFSLWAFGCICFKAITSHRACSSFRKRVDSSSSSRRF
jgi:hypothetical protein